ncbi:MAG: glucose 1-dehydrogenase [Chloroflexota bacterium]
MGTFSDKIILVTGSASGIGRDTALAFAHEGGLVVGTDINVKEGEATHQLIIDSGGSSEFYAADVSKHEDVANLVETIKARHGRLDVAFNNAGVEGAPVRTADTTEDEFDFIMRVNVKGVWLCMKYEIQLMASQEGGGSIINTSSVAGLVGSHSLPIYSASKHAVVGLTKSAAVEYGGKGIRVNSVNPYMINTPMVERSSSVLPPEFTQAFVNATPAKRFGDPSEVTAAVLWLASDAASYINGVTLAVDGGYTAR